MTSHVIFRDGRWFTQVDFPTKRKATDFAVRLWVARRCRVEVYHLHGEAMSCDIYHDTTTEEEGDLVSRPLFQEVLTRP